MCHIHMYVGTNTSPGRGREGVKFDLETMRPRAQNQGQFGFFTKDISLMPDEGRTELEVISLPRPDFWHSI